MDEGRGVTVVGGVVVVILEGMVVSA